MLRGGGTLAVLGLGSCVAVIMHEPQAVAGGIVHVVLPSMSLSRDRSNAARFAETAIPLLLSQMEAAGADRGRVAARLVGGASMFAALTPAGTVHIGRRNVVACRLALRAAGVPIVGEAVDGDVGRSVRFDVGSGAATVRSVGRDPYTI